jgi:hypothetical protein
MYASDALITFILLISVMACHQSSTRSSSSHAVPSSLSSSVYFEQWEIRDAARNHKFIGNNAFFAGTTRTSTSVRVPSNVLTCWEVNMGYIERGKIPEGLNDLDCWKELVTPCCHCVSFKQDRPLKKKLLSFSSNHDVDIAARYQCQSLWEALYRPLHEKRKTDVGQKAKKRTRVEANTNWRRAPRTNKHKSGRKMVSAASAVPELPISNVSFSTGGVAMSFDDAVKDLEAKLKANYEYLCLYKEENE